MSFSAAIARASALQCPPWQCRRNTTSLRPSYQGAAVGQTVPASVWGLGFKAETSVSLAFSRSPRTRCSIFRPAWQPSAPWSIDIVGGRNALKHWRISAAVKRCYMQPLARFALQGSQVRLKRHSEFLTPSATSLAGPVSRSSMTRIMARRTNAYSCGAVNRLRRSRQQNPMDSSILRCDNAAK